MEKGLFKQAGIDITGLLTSQGGGTTMRNVLSGGLPYGEVALSAVIAAINEGIDVKIVNFDGQYGTLNNAYTYVHGAADHLALTWEDSSGNPVSAVTNATNDVNFTSTSLSRACTTVIRS